MRNKSLAMDADQDAGPWKGRWTGCWISDKSQYSAEAARRCSGTGHYNRLNTKHRILDAFSCQMLNDDGMLESGWQAERRVVGRYVCLLYQKWERYIAVM